MIPLTLVVLKRQLSSKGRANSIQAKNKKKKEIKSLHLYLNATIQLIVTNNLWMPSVCTEDAYTNTHATWLYFVYFIHILSFHTHLPFFYLFIDFLFISISFHGFVIQISTEFISHFFFLLCFHYNKWMWHVCMYRCMYGCMDVYTCVCTILPDFETNTNTNTSASV